MARLPDEQWAMIEDCIDKKRTAASAFKQRTHCGKGGRVRFPSDFKSKKELKAMNGEVKSYRLNSAMSWDEFKSMPDDLKVAYINGIRERFSAPDKYVADMFGISQGQFGLYIKDLKLDVALEKGEWNKEAFLAWVSGADTNLVKEVEPEEEKDGDEYAWNPMTWAELKTMSDVDKIAYIWWIRGTFKTPDKNIAEMLGVTPGTFSVLVRSLGCGNTKQAAAAARNWDSTEFDAWVRGERVVEEVVEEPVEAVNEETLEIISEPAVEVEKTVEVDKADIKTPVEIVPESRPEPLMAIPTFGELNFDCSADQALNTLAMLLGNKHVQLNVRWDVVAD